MDALLDRISAALHAGAAIPTAELTALLLEAGGEHCYQRPRLIHRLTAILHATRPPMATSTTHRFKSSFAHKDFSGFPLVVGDKTKIVTAHNLTDEDVPLLIQYGGGHLIEPLTSKAAQPEGTQTAATGILQTAVETTETGTVIKHSSGGPDDLPIEAPIALEAKVVTPDKKADKEIKPAKAEKSDEKHK